MNKMTKKLILSALTVVLTVIALGTTTFAWFTLTNTATVDPFDVDIATDFGIEISVDGINWFTNINNAQLADFLDGVVLQDVTSKDGDRILNIEGNAASAGSYLEFPLYFRSNTVQAVEWNQAVSALSATNNVWLADVEFSHPNVPLGVVAGEPYTFNAANAARISMTQYSFDVAVDDPGSDDAAISGVTQGNLTVPNPDYDDQLPDDPDTNPEFLPANYVYELPQGAGTGTAENTRLNATAIAAGNVDYYLVKTNVDLLATLGAPTLPSSISNTELAAGQQVLSLTNTDYTEFGFQYAGLIVVRVWIEGWDADSFNAILGQTISVTLRFAAVEV
jgi:hypothetical protein